MNGVGASDQAETALPFVDNDSESLHLGRNLQGLLDEVEIYDRVLTSRQIVERMATAQ